MSAKLLDRGGRSLEQPTPSDLASELHADAKAIRAFLRARFPRPATDHGAPWSLSPAEAEAVRERFGSHHREVDIPPRPHLQRQPNAYQTAWFWEGNVQDTVEAWLRAAGWRIESRANTATRAPGDDLLAVRGSERLVVEVKGFPSKDYADPTRAGEIKATSPTTQARHWYSQALLRSLRVVGTRRGVTAAIALPDHPTYRSLIDDTRKPLHRLGIVVLLVDAHCTVTVAVGGLSGESL